MGRPPSTFTMCAPAAMISAALRKVSWAKSEGAERHVADEKARLAPRATHAV